ncbi:MAG: hypothetical protein KGJ98_10610 [Chloroflexota bacterium]|nr:hypothetical protein [Chloroflexota bacterium]
MSGLLIREGPATELTVATRILARLGILAPDGRIAVLVGTEVVYLPARGVAASTMTPYDVAALRLRDGSMLAGTPPDDAERYLAALRGTTGARAAALTGGGTMEMTPDLATLVEGLARTPWGEAEGEARAAGALVGAYPVPEG